MPRASPTRAVVHIEPRHLFDARVLGFRVGWRHGPSAASRWSATARSSTTCRNLARLTARRWPSTSRRRCPPEGGPQPRDRPRARPAWTDQHQHEGARERLEAADRQGARAAPAARQAAGRAPWRRPPDSRAPPWSGRCRAPWRGVAAMPAASSPCEAEKTRISTAPAQGRVPAASTTPAARAMSRGAPSRGVGEVDVAAARRAGRFGRTREPSGLAPRHREAEERHQGEAHGLDHRAGPGHARGGGAQHQGTHAHEGDGHQRWSRAAAKLKLKPRVRARSPATM